jgi:maltose O-acetyltransferase
MGAKVGASVSWGLDATMDVLVPENISIGDETIIGYGTLLLGHEFLQREYRLGEVEIGRRVVVGANSTVLPGVRIADDSVVGAGSLVNRDVEGFVGGVPARPVRR